MTSLPKLYNAWFCPFAQRAWIAMLEKRVDFELVEVDPYEKTPEWLAINPRGMVPTIVHHGKSVYESTVCIEYIDEVWDSGSRRLLPNDPYKKACVRIQSDYIGKKIVPPFYQILVKQSKEDQEVAKQDLVAGLKVLFSEKDKSSGSLFGGQELNMVDIMLFPHAYRIKVILTHYRGWTVPEAGLEQYHEWYAAVSKSESVQKTMPEEEKLIENYRRYAEDTTQSAVAKAVRKGTTLP
jgi:glutathione S-transferase